MKRTRKYECKVDMLELKMVDALAEREMLRCNLDRDEADVARHEANPATAPHARDMAIAKAHYSRVCVDENAEEIGSIREARDLAHRKMMKCAYVSVVGHVTRVILEFRIGSVHKRMSSAGRCVCVFIYLLCGVK